MNNKKQAQDALLEAIDIMIENKLKNLGFNYYVDGVIQSKNNNNNTYNVLINDTLYKDIPSKNNLEYSVDDTVQILVKNGNWNKKIIDDKIGHNKVPQNLLNLGTRIRIYGNDDFNNYTTIGSYGVYSNADANTISNMPCKMAGALDVYVSNGEKSDESPYTYLIQEYTALDGYSRYYRAVWRMSHGWAYNDWERILDSNLVKDYIVHQNTSGIWSCEKWNSGKAICRGIFVQNNVAVNNPWGNLFESAGYKVDLPVNLFVETPQFDITLVGTKGTMLSIYSEGDTTRTPYMCAVRPYAETVETLNTSIVAYGRWK